MFTCCDPDIASGGLTWQTSVLQVTQDIYDDSRGQNSLLDGTVRRPLTRDNTAQRTDPTLLPKWPLPSVYWRTEQRVRQFQDVPFKHEYSVRSIRAKRQGRRADPARNRRRIRSPVPPLEGPTSIVRTFCLCSTSSNNPLAPLLSVRRACSFAYVLLSVALPV